MKNARKVTERKDKLLQLKTRDKRMNSWKLNVSRREFIANNQILIREEWTSWTRDCHSQMSFSFKWNASDSTFNCYWSIGGHKQFSKGSRCLKIGNSSIILKHQVPVGRWSYLLFLSLSQVIMVKRGRKQVSWKVEKFFVFLRSFFFEEENTLKKQDWQQWPHGSSFWRRKAEKMVWITLKIRYIQVVCRSNVSFLHLQS